MFPLCALFTLQADFCGRIDSNHLPQDALLELLVAHFDDPEAFRDGDGAYEDIREWKGLEFDENGDVIVIHWEFDDWEFAHNPAYFEAVRPNGSIVLIYLPNSVKDFSIAHLKLVGTVDTSVLPENLDALDIQNNKFSGKFVTATLPRSIKYLFLQHNKFVGSFHLEGLPQVFQSLDISCNNFEGTLNFAKIPESAVYLFLQHNNFAGSVNFERAPQNLVSLWINGNNFRQSVLRVGGKMVEMRSVRVEPGAFESAVDFEGEPLSMTREFDDIVVKPLDRQMAQTLDK